MKRLNLAACCLLLAVCSCSVAHYANTKPYRLTEGEFVGLKVEKPVSVENASTEDTDRVLCRAMNRTAYGSLHQFTETAVGMVEKTLGEDEIAGDRGDAGKKLELTIDSAHCETGTWRVAVYVTLTARTGSGLEKHYEADAGFMNWYALSPTCERAIGHTVKQMLSDQDIIAYLVSE